MPTTGFGYKWICKLCNLGSCFGLKKKLIKALRVSSLTRTSWLTTMRSLRAASCHTPSSQTASGSWQSLWACWTPSRRTKTACRSLLAAWASQPHVVFNHVRVSEMKLRFTSKTLNLRPEFRIWDPLNFPLWFLLFCPGFYCWAWQKAETVPALSPHHGTQLRWDPARGRQPPAHRSETSGHAHWVDGVWYLLKKKILNRSPTHSNKNGPYEF